MNCPSVQADRLGGGGVGVRGVLLRGQRSSERAEPEDGGYDAELPERHIGRRLQHHDGGRRIQHEALDEQKCRVCFCLLDEDAGRTLREGDT